MILNLNQICVGESLRFRVWYFENFDDIFFFGRHFDDIKRKEYKHYLFNYVVSFFERKKIFI